jgi:hypothetical protein
MWVFLNDSFFSIVQDRNDENMVAVRARVEGDLERTFGGQHEVLETEDSDYRFRMFLNKEYVSNVMKEKVLSIDYDNFKDSINKKDINRKSYYTRVWAVMNDWQEKVFGSSWNKWYLDYRK